jgi:hypothetical protein
MYRKIIFIILLISLFSFTYNSFAKEKAGYALLDKLNLGFKEMAEKGTGGWEEVSKFLQGLMVEAKKAKKEELIDPVFYRKYTRLLMILKLFVIPDKEGILTPLIERELSEFVEDVTGEKKEGLTGKSAIGIVASAVAEEILNLYLYLKTKKDRAELMKELEKKFGARPKKNN